MNYQALLSRSRKSTWMVVPIFILLSSFWVYGQKESSRGARQHYQKGVELLAKQQLDQAIAELLAATKLNPRLVEAHNALGLALARKGEINTAGESFRKA